MGTRDIDIKGYLKVGASMFGFRKEGEREERFMYRHTEKMDRISDIPVRCLEGYCKRFGNLEFGGGFDSPLRTARGVEVACEIMYDIKMSNTGCICVLWEVGSYGVIEAYSKMFAYCCKCMVEVMGIKAERVVVYPMPITRALEIRVYCYGLKDVVLQFSRYSFL